MSEDPASPAGRVIFDKIYREAFTGAAMKRLPKSAVALAWLIAAQSARGAELTVFAAASLSDALKEMSAGYEKQGGDKLVFNFGASSTLARQIEEGAPADVFFSADEARMDALEKLGLIARETRRSRLSNVLVIVVPADSRLRFGSVRDLAGQGVRRIALADPRAVPAGVYARAYLEKTGLWENLERKIVPTENVRGALAAVESGNVDAGIVYKTDAAVSRGVRVAWVVRREEGPDIRYAVAVVKESARKESAERFLRFLDTGEADRVFQRYGFITLKPRR